MRRNRIKAFTIVEVMISITIISILVALSAPKYARAKAKTNLSACEENLKAIAMAMDMCMARHPEYIRNGSNTVWFIIDEDCVLYERGYLSKIPKCPGNGGGYVLYYYPTKKFSQEYYYIHHRGGGTGAHINLDIEYPYPRYDSKGSAISYK